MTDNQTFLLFAENDQDAARIEAIDQLHNATNYYTAEPIIDQLLAHLDWPHGSRRMIDASCGDGAFLGRALTKALTMRAFDDTDLPNHIEGWEIHGYACSQARSRVASILISFGRSASQAAHLAERIVHNRDFLTEAPTEAAFDCFCGNPPYLRRANIPALLRDEYDQCVPKYAAADMMHAFLERGLRVLREGGQIGVIVADRVLLNTTAGELREQLGSRLAIEHVERLDASTAFYKPKQKKKGTPARVHPLLLVMSEQGAIPLGKAPIYPGVDESKYEGLPTLGDLVTVKIGPYLGPAGVFSVTPDEARAAGLPPEVLVRAVDCDDIEDEQLGPTTKRYAILTRPDVRPCEAVMRHLKKHIEALSGDEVRSSDWMPPETWHGRDLSQASLMVPRIATSPKAVWVPPGVIPINHDLSILSSDLQLLARVKRALEGELAAQWMREHMPPIENGYHTLNTERLRMMPIKLD
jgi:tRNA1(Val) A37 N6-methylase TrmN6